MAKVEYSCFQAYTHQMAACLAHLSDEGLTDESNSPAMQRLLDMSIEHGSLLAIIAMSNPGAFKDIQNCKLDEGVVCLDARAPSFYYNIVVSWQHDFLLKLRFSKVDACSPVSTQADVYVP